MKRIVGIGLSNIDIISHVSDDFLDAHSLIKGQARKLTISHFLQLKADLDNYHVEAGGCAGNTLCGLDKSQIKATFFGKVGNDKYTKIYRDSFKKYDVLFPVQNGDIDSSQCAVLITPDGERSFAYMHGASWQLSPDDLYIESIKDADLVYTEVYAMAFGMQTGLWPLLVNYMRDYKRHMAMKVVDKEYVALYKTAIFALAEEGILTLLAGNKDNLGALANRDTIEDTLDVLSKWKCNILLTDGKNGAYYADAHSTYHYDVPGIERPNNTSGAGDQFVAGFLEGWIFDEPIPACMKKGHAKATQILMLDAPRPPKA